ncbi:hypothetical protein D3C80_1294060 [compost metagenome]
MQVAHAGVDQLRVDLHQLQDRLRANQQAAGNQPDKQCQPQGLAHQWADLGVLAGAEALCDLGCGGQEDAGHQQEHRNPDRVAQCHGGQVTWAYPPGHDGIDKAHGSSGQLRDDNG